LKRSGIDFEFRHAEDEGSFFNGNAVLLFHGLTGSPFEMKKYGQFLYRLGFDAFCYAFPGHGERLGELKSTTWEDWCGSAQDAYDELRRNYKRFYVSGLCLGSDVALYLAENNADVSGVVSLSTLLFCDGPCLPKARCLLPFALNTILRYLYTFPEDDSMGVKNELTRKALARVMGRTTVSLDNYPLCCIYETSKLSKVIRKNLSKITAPVLLIHSALDNLASPRGAKLVYDNISSAVKEYVELKDSYHMILYDNEKAVVLKKVEEFLGDCAAC